MRRAPRRRPRPRGCRSRRTDPRGSRECPCAPRRDHRRAAPGTWPDTTPRTARGRVPGPVPGPVIDSRAMADGDAMPMSADGGELRKQLEAAEAMAHIGSWEGTVATGEGGWAA